MPAKGAFGYKADTLTVKAIKLAYTAVDFRDDWGAYFNDEETLTNLSQLQRENRELEEEIEQLDNEDPAHPVVAATLREEELYNERDKTYQAHLTIKEQAARIAELEADLYNSEEKLRNEQQLHDKVKSLEAKVTANESLAKQVDTLTTKNIALERENAVLKDRNDALLKENGSHSDKRSSAQILVDDIGGEEHVKKLRGFLDKAGGHIALEKNLLHGEAARRFMDNKLPPHMFVESNVGQGHEFPTVARLARALSLIEVAIPFLDKLYPQAVDSSVESLRKALSLSAAVQRFLNGTIDNQLSQIAAMGAKASAVDKIGGLDALAKQDFDKARYREWLEELAVDVSCWFVLRHDNNGLQAEWKDIFTRDDWWVVVRKHLDLLALDWQENANRVSKLCRYVEEEYPAIVQDQKLQIEALQTSLTKTDETCVKLVEEVKKRDEVVRKLLLRINS